MEDLRLLTKTISELEEKLHKINLEIDNILYKKSKPMTFEESTKLHNKIMKKYKKRDDLISQIKQLEKDRHDLRQQISSNKIQSIINLHT